VSDLLSEITKRGACVRVAPGQADATALAHLLRALRTAGHAIVAEETFTHEKRSLGITVTHYLSCSRCPK